MYVDERQRKLILKLANRKICDEDFLREFSTTTDERQELGLSILRAALACQNADDVEYGLITAFHFGFNPSYIDVLYQLAEEDWHYKHEDVVSALASLKPPGCVDILYRTALKNYEYLDYDDSYALGVKAIWALGSVGTKEAIGRLKLLAKSENATLQANAKKQLKRLAEAGSTEEVRAAAFDEIRALSQKENK